MPTATGAAATSPKAQAETPHAVRIISSDSIPAGGFTPGTILADRYRIIGLLGRGGMGEVYRADDLKLGQPVALKFLPPKLAEDPVRRERFFAEVRITRQLSHPNICRVYDIGEIDGRHFLSMEYIDGEDLASLTKRIGHLSNEKALDIARQLAAGLAAAHERGVLHRDLKPANIMLDGHGRVRITDFGLAIAQEDESQAAEIAGTPAYMAPEQLAGKGATIRSDLYSLGLILYEIYTGRKAFTATTLAELRQEKETRTPTAVSEIREGIDPVVERLIRRCMECDPNARPGSVAQLALALPGGDPLAAALAAGETPSPEMVAASGSREGLRPAVAWGLLAFTIVSLVAALIMKDRVSMHRRVPFEKHPEALVQCAQDILRKAGFSGKFADSAYGFMENSDLVRYLHDTEKPTDRWQRYDVRAIFFWYRRSPQSLGILRSTFGNTAPDTPPIKVPGEVLVFLDTEGRLVSLRAVPLQAQQEAETATPPDWTSLFSAAGLDISKWKPEKAQRIPDSYADARYAWVGADPNRPGVPGRIEAAAYQGKPVSFEIMDPWIQKAPAESAQTPAISLLFGIGAVLFVVPVLLGGIFFARRNLRLGRGDRRGATRLALFVLALSVLTWILQLPRGSLISLLLILYLPVLTWIFYMAVEPYVRRRWTRILISVTRLLSGELRDPLVARDTLIGIGSGAFLILISFCLRVVPSRALVRFGTPVDLESYTGARFAVSELLTCFIAAVIISLMVVCSLVILRIVLRNQIAAAVVFIAICVLLTLSDGIPGALIFSVMGCVLVLRFSLVASTAWFFTLLVIENAPITLQASAWYSGYGYLVLAIFAALVFYAFRFSLGSRPILAPSRLDD